MNLYDLHPDPENAPYRDVAYERVPELAWEKYRDRPEELRKREKAFARDAHYAYLYAHYVLRGPFPAGEPAIARDPKEAYHYAANVLRGPFPAGEPAIARRADWSFLYARDVLDKKPFPAGEPAIARDPHYAYWYARDVLGLWPLESRSWSLAVIARELMPRGTA